MTAERWQRVKSLFERALDQPRGRARQPCSTRRAKAPA